METGDGNGHSLIPTVDSYGHALADIVRCACCGHMQLARFPTDAELLEAYALAASEDYVGEEKGQRETARAALDRIEQRVPVGRLLDLGCWVGFVLLEARSRGWEVTGLEPSAFASGYARDRLGLPVVTGDLFTAELPDASFDAVVLGDVFEHLVRPGEALERIGELLAPGGIVYMALPDAGSALARRLGPRWWSVLPTHVQYFTRTSMRTLLVRNGYTPLFVGTAPKSFTVDYYLWRVGGYSPQLSRAMRLVARQARMQHRLWTPDFRDRMAVVARAPARNGHVRAAAASGAVAALASA